MPSRKVTLPNGDVIDVQYKEGTPDRDILGFAMKQYVTSDASSTAFQRGIAEGIDNLQKAYGSTIEGLGNILDSESLRQIGADVIQKEEAEIAARQYRVQRDVPQDVGGFKKGMRYVETLAGQSAPQMGVTAAGAATGAAIGAAGGPLAPITVPAGAFVGGFLANVPYFFGSNRERQKEAIDRGIKVEVDEGAAALAAIPQSSLDAIVTALGAKFLAAPLMKSGGGIFTRSVKGAGVGAATETPTEIGQAVLERAQAGLPLADKEALVEYAEVGAGGALLGGLGGGAVGAARTPSVDGEVDQDQEQRKTDVGDRGDIPLDLKTFNVTYTDSISGQELTQSVEALDADHANTLFNDALGDAYDTDIGITIEQEGAPTEPIDDVTAEAAVTYMPLRFVGERAEAAPPFFKKFQPEQYDEGRFVDIETSEDLSDQTFEGGSIRIEDGRPKLETSDESAESIMPSKASEEGALVRTNLFKQKAGWKWTQAPEGEPSTIVSVEQGSKHYYTLDFTSGKPLTLKTYPEKTSEPRGRPTTRGEVKLGNQVGEIEIRGKKHPVYDRVTVGDPEVAAGAAPVVKINATNQVDAVDSTVTQLVEPVDTDPAEGGKVRSIAKRFRLRTGIIDFRKLFKTTGALKVSNRVYNTAVKKAADRISKVLDKSFVQFPQFEAWYSSRLNMAMDIFEELDPDLAKPEDRFIMKTLLAVTSNGNEVSDQTAESFRIYKDWKRTGRLEQQSTQGTREEAILGHLLLVDELISRVGWKELESFMSKVGPVSELRKELESRFGFTKKRAKDMTTGELVNEVVPYSLFLGPKLGSFFNNLNGNFETTTMDRWFMRTFGRTMGDQLVKVDIQATRTRLFNAIDALISNPKSRLLGELKKQGLLPKSGKQITKNQIKRISTYFSLKANREGLTPVENEVRLAVNKMAQVSDGLKLIEAPASGSHRRFIRAVMKEALADFNKKNATNFTPAEAQAILWYYEKLIHESNGSRQKGEAPDYAAGANAIYRNLNGRDSGRFVRSDVIRRRGDLPSGTQGLPQRDITAPAAAAGNRAFNQPLPDATTVSEQYARSSGIPFQKPERITSLNKERAAKIGRAFDEMKHDPTNPEVREAYDALVRETLEQYQSILDAGYSIEINNTEPYNNSAEMIEDLRNRKTMRVFSTEFGFGDKGISAKDRRENPMLAETEFTDTNGTPLLVNDVFRFVHDFFGHAKLGNGFGPIGEENAWNVHSRMYSPLARRAMTTETRGQNSWVNFSGVNDKAFEIRDRARQARREGNDKEAQRLTEEAYDTMKFADQKIGLMPEEFTRTDDEVSAEAGVVLRPEERAPEGGFSSRAEMEEFIKKNFSGIASKLGVDLYGNFAVGRDAQYNVTQGAIEYNPRTLFLNRTRDGVRAAIREEIIHAAMHKVLMKRSPSKSRNNAWLDFMSGLGKDLSQEQRDAIAGVYGALRTDADFGAEYSRAAIQNLLYGEVTEQFTKGKAADKLKSLFKSVQSYLARILGKSIKENPEAAAVIRDSVDLVRSIDPEARITNQKVAAEAEKIADKQDGTAEVSTDVVVNAAQPPSKKKDLSAFDKFIFTATSVIQRISPEISRLFKQFFFTVEKQTLDHLNRVQPFIKKYNGIKNKADKKRLKQLLMYSPDIDPNAEERQQRVLERTTLLRKYDMLNDYNLRVRPVLDTIRIRANQEGMDVPYLTDYFPRRILDLDKIREFYGQVVVKDFSSYIERINEERRAEVDPSKRKPPIQRGSNEEALEFDKYIRSGEYTKRGIKPRNTQQRTIEFIEDEITDAYADPGEAIESYIQSMVLATETMRLLGRRYEVEGDNVRMEKASELGRTLQGLIAEGKIDEEQAFRTIPQFAKIILNPVMKENSFLGGMRSFSYFSLLVEPTTTLSQLFDLPFQMYDKGFFPVLSAALGKKTFRLGDVGIDNNQISAEFKNERKWMDEAVRLGLKSTGFTRLDQLMKETAMNANYNQYRKLARGYYRNRDSNASKKLKAELDFMMGDDADAAIAALKKGDRNNPLVRELIRNKLLETQPISRMEMPLIVSQNPNTRALFTMKSFMVTQLNFVVNKFLSRIFSSRTTKGEKLRASADLAKLMFFMVAIGLPVDALKDLLAGRLGYMSDYVFNGIFRVAGISRYQTYVARKEGIGQAAFDYVTPVGIQQAVDITAEIQRVATGDKAITDSKLVTLAPFSDVINRLFGFSREREQREYERRAGEGDLPTFIPPGAL